MADSSMMVPGDFNTEQATIDRRRAIAQALMQQGMASNAQGQMISGHYIPPSIGDQLTPFLNAVTAGKMNKDLDAQSADLAQRYQAGLGDAVQKYLDTKQGTTWQVAQQGPTMDDEPLPDRTEVVAADPRRAIVEAMTSQYKPLQTLGNAELSNLGKTALTQKDILSLSGFSPESKVSAAMNLDASKLAGERKSHVINDRLVQELPSGASQVSGDYRSTFGKVEPVGFDEDGKPIYGQADKDTNKVTFAPQGTKVNIDTNKKGADAFSVEANKAAVQNLQDSRAAALKGQSGFEVMSNAATQMNNIKGGTGAEYILQAKKLAAQLGAPVDPSITSQEQVTAGLAQALLDNAKTLGSGSGFSDQDRKFLQEVTLGRASLDPATLKRAVNIGLATSINAIHNHNDAVDRAGALEGASPELLQQFKVAEPDYSLNAKDFNYDPKTRRFTVLTSQGSVPSPNRGQTSTTAPQSALSPAEQKELAQLRAHFGVGGQ